MRQVAYLTLAIYLGVWGWGVLHAEYLAYRASSANLRDSRDAVHRAARHAWDRVEGTPEAKRNSVQSAISRLSDRLLVDD